MSSINQDSVRQALSTVKYPGFSRDIISFGLLRDVVVSGSDIDVQLVLSTNDTGIAKKSTPTRRRLCKPWAEPAVFL